MLLTAMATAAVASLTSDPPTRATLVEVGCRVQYTSASDMLYSLRGREFAQEYSQLLKRIVPCRPEPELLCPAIVPFLNARREDWALLAANPTFLPRGRKIVAIHSFMQRFYWGSDFA